MPSTIWSGAISFGLVTIPIKVISATEDHSIHFHQVHLEDMGRVRTRKVCEIDGEAVSQDEIGKGYAAGKRRRAISREQAVASLDQGGRASSLAP